MVRLELWELGYGGGVGVAIFQRSDGGYDADLSTASISIKYQIWASIPHVVVVYNHLS